MDFGYESIDKVFSVTQIQDVNELIFDNIFINNFHLHGSLFSYRIYALLEDHNRTMGYGIMGNDFLALFNCFNRSDIRKNIIYYYDDNVEYEFIRIDNNLVELFKNTKHNQFGSLPIAQTIIFNHDETVINELIKRPEIYMISKIAIALANDCIIDIQHNILDYRIDGLFTIKSLTCDNIDKIALEIDENNHNSYDKQKEQIRSDILKIFKHRLISIPVQRNASKKVMDELVNDVVGQIRAIIKDLLAQYSLDSISEAEFIEKLDNEMFIDKDFAKLFAKKNHPEFDNFKYEHSEIARFLGYVCDDNGYCRTFTELMKKHLRRNIDYITVIEDDKKPADIRRLFDAQIKVGRGQKIKYYLTRVGFYLICISANTIKSREYKIQFARVYEIALNYVQQLKNKIASSQPNYETSKVILTGRIDDKVNEKIERKRECKIELKYNELLKEYDQLKQQLVIKENEIKLKNSMIIDMDDKIKICNRELFLAKSSRTIPLVLTLQNKNCISKKSKPKKEKKHKRIIDSNYTFNIIDINDEDFMIKLNDYQNKLIHDRELILIKKKKNQKKIIDFNYLFDIIDINDDDFMVKLNDYQNKLNKSIKLNNNHVIVVI